MELRELSGVGVAEETEGAGAQASGAETSGLAIDLAMEEARGNPALHCHVAAFLRNQNSLVDIQKHHLHKQLRPALWEKWLGVLLRVATAFVGLAVAAGIAFMVWDASRSSRLLVEPFSVPPELAARGVTGEVVAARLLARIRAIQAQTASSRAPRTFSNSWSEKDLRVEIPETGVSLGQIDSFLRARLGHDTHISGEIVTSPAGLALSARADADEAGTVTGAEADLDAMIGRLAEAVYKQTQPYLYAAWLGGHGRGPEAIAIFRELAENGAPAERPWAYMGWGLQVRDTLGLSAALELMSRGVALAPRNFPVRGEYAGVLTMTGRTERGLAATREALALSQTSRDEVSAQLASRQNAMRAAIASASGAYLEALRETAKSLQDPDAQRVGLTTRMAGMQRALHDLKAARATLANPLRLTAVIGVGQVAMSNVLNPMRLDIEAEDWSAAVARAAGFDAVLAQYPGDRELFAVAAAPELAYAQARLGHFAEAEALLRPTPGDCYACLIARARVAELQGQRGRADFWFARAVAEGPSLPSAHEDWGRVLLARGRPDDAIAQFTLANKLGPHFADPLEGWGEALMAKNQSHLALAKFKEAEKYAPNWGRLELKWGEALVYAGKKDEAKAQFARAATLDLTPSEKAELAKAQSHA